MVGPGGRRFAFLDAPAVVRRLGIDRLTLDQWVKEGRLRTHRGMGKDVFFRATEVEELYKELHADDEEQVEVVEAVPVDSSVPAGVTRRKNDPQMRVYLRLQADARWYDISDEDIRAWYQQLDADGYERNRTNALHTIGKLQFLVSLLEEGIAAKATKETQQRPE
ncbi:MAG TPA: hypothetical protein VL461_05570 [Dictyobacter sp.]|jgi:hypothetical protein|nr:hypothetical protein [Dictyobacter sp.]